MLNESRKSSPLKVMSIRRERKLNARRNAISNIRWIALRSLNCHSLKNRKERFTKIILDPPERGQGDEEDWPASTQAR